MACTASCTAACTSAMSSRPIGPLRLAGIAGGAPCTQRKVMAFQSVTTSATTDGVQAKHVTESTNPALIDLTMSSPKRCLLIEDTLLYGASHRQILRNGWGNRGVSIRTGLRGRAWDERRRVTKLAQL